MMQQGGANLPEPEMLKAKHAALAAHFEEMRKKHEELQPKVEELLNVKGGRAKMNGTVYLIHLDSPTAHASHYIGWTRFFKQRIEHHKRGTGARFLAEAVRRGRSTFQNPARLDRRARMVSVWQLGMLPPSPSPKTSAIIGRCDAADGIGGWRLNQPLYFYKKSL
jgi:hypothetical protein